jgi:hypothetical protein
MNWLHQRILQTSRFLTDKYWSVCFVLQIITLTCSQKYRYCTVWAIYIQYGEVYISKDLGKALPASVMTFSQVYSTSFSMTYSGIRLPNLTTVYKQSCNEVYSTLICCLRHLFTEKHRWWEKEYSWHFWKLENVGIFRWDITRRLGRTTKQRSREKKIEQRI